MKISQKISLILIAFTFMFFFNVQAGNADPKPKPAASQPSAAATADHINDLTEDEHLEIMDNPEEHTDEMLDSHAGSTNDGHGNDDGGHGDDDGHAAANLDTEKIANYLLAFVVLVGAIAIVMVSSRSIQNSTKNGFFDLLSVKPLARIVRLKYFRLSLQLINVAVFITIIYLGFYGIQNASKSVTYSLTWYFWWPVFFLLIIFFGRIWCMVCPFAALADWAQKIVNFNKKFPKKLQNLWIATVLFLVLHFAYIWWISGNPWMTALAVVVGFIIPALVVGIVYQRRTFCQYVCPLGGLLTVYSLISPLKIVNKSDEVCRNCKTKDCYQGNEFGEGCPVGKVVTNIKRSGDCLLCLECAKTCRNDNVAVKLQPFGTDLWNSTKRTIDESTVGVIMVGLVVTKTAIMLEPWNRFVQWFAHALGLGIDFAANLLFVGLTFVFPLSFTFLAIWLIRGFLGKQKANFWDLYKIWGYMLVPVALALQLAHELDHLLNESTKVISAIGIWLSPTVPAFQELANMSIASPVSPEALFFIKILLPVGGFIFTLLIGHRMANKIFQDTKTITANLVPMYLLTIAFTIVSVYLMGMPMN